MVQIYCTDNWTDIGEGPTRGSIKGVRPGGTAVPIQPLNYVAPALRSPFSKHYCKIMFVQYRMQPILIG